MRAGGGRRAGKEGAVRCGGAGGARNWREGAAEAADSGGQRSSGEVVERRRKKDRNAGVHEGIEEGRSSLGAFQSQKEARGHIPKPKRGAWTGGKQLLAVNDARGGSGG
jgi:hypothetical protein